jgi:hypothetical protein
VRFDRGFAAYLISRKMVGGLIKAGNREQGIGNREQGIGNRG